MTIWSLQGTPAQNTLVERAIALCDFPYDSMLPSLRREGKEQIRVEWADLSRYGEQAKAAVESDTSTIRASADGHDHEHVTDSDGAVAHPIERVVDGRKRVLGLFYLPPHTKVVLDAGLQVNPTLAAEVFLAEAAHAVDYHFMTPDHRRAIVNQLHRDDLPAGASVADGAAFNLDGHTCSWFDVGPYRMWVGEAFMEAFIEAFAPAVPVTIQLGHPTGPEQARAIREVLVPTPVAPEPTPLPDLEPAAPEPPPHDHHPVFRSTAKGTKVYHDEHGGLEVGERFDSAHDAEDAGLRACKVCKPA